MNSQLDILLKNSGRNPETVLKQLEYFNKGVSFSNIISPATPEHGILKMNEKEKKAYISLFDQSVKNETILKFIPASGAASRMFKALSSFMNSNEQEPADENVKEFFERIEEFAFYPHLKTLCDENKINIKSDFKKVLELFLTQKGLNYANLPKSLLLFHKYENENRTSAEEHFVEAINYVATKGKASLHFTVSVEHRAMFEQHIEELKSKYSGSHKIDFCVDISEQKPHTDTIAVDLNNEPFKTEDGNILFRPGGHGALIENLNELDADIVFVKNIDNVVHDKLKQDTYDYKKALAGILLEVRNKVFRYLNTLDTENDDLNIEEIQNFIQKYFSFTFPESYFEFDRKNKTEFLFKQLNRPIRVCGMVKNEGEPGGGPFFVKGKDGSVNLQIVESAQIDMKNPVMQDIVSKATHFNPVDLILGMKDYKGNSFNLKEFIDSDSIFISEKSLNGKALKALELPGLWNGAMADWNTIFVEVPITTFNPVKTVNDLLRPEHLQ